MNLMTIMYIAIQETLNDPDDMTSTYGKLRVFCPPLVLKADLADESS